VRRTSRKPGRAANTTATKRPAPRAKPRKAASKPKSGKPPKPRLLSGENPQIAKGYGDAPVRAYIAAVPGWKRDVAGLNALSANPDPAPYGGLAE
jgi:hypothetical protein